MKKVLFLSFLCSTISNHINANAEQVWRLIFTCVKQQALGAEAKEEFDRIFAPSLESARKQAESICKQNGFDAIVINQESFYK